MYDPGARSQTALYGGMNYAPFGLESLWLATSSNGGMERRTGPGARVITQGAQRLETDGSSRAAPLDQYGPLGFGRLPNMENTYLAFSGGPNVWMSSPSLLTSFAWMIGDKRSPKWAANNNADRMKNTFTSGKQMKSLWDRILGSNRGQTPVASGGPTLGWQYSNPYGHAWTADQAGEGSIITGSPTTWIAQLRKLFDDGAITQAQEIGARAEMNAQYLALGANMGQWQTLLTAETLSPIKDRRGEPVIITQTGLQNIPGMTGPSI